MRLYLIRHGQSTWNKQNRIQGHSNPPLTEKGRTQIGKLIPRLKREGIEKIIASPLKRAHESAQILAKGLGVECHTYRGLMEIFLGEWEGMSPDEINQSYNDGYKKWLKGPSKIRIPKAETISQFRRRAVKAFKEIVASETKERVVLVTHGGILTALISHWLKADFDKVLLSLFCENSCLTIAEVYEGKVYLTEVNDTAHLHGPHFQEEPPV